MIHNLKPHPYDFDALVQERCNSNVLAMEFHFSYTKPNDLSL